MQATTIWACPYAFCPATFPTEAAVAAHIQFGHTNMTLQQCPVCPFNTQRMSELDNHMASNHPGTDLPCPSCSKSFKQAYALSVHCQNEHGANGGKQCHHCGQVFEAKDRGVPFRKHLSKHYQEDKKLRFGGGVATAAAVPVAAVGIAAPVAAPAPTAPPIPAPLNAAPSVPAPSHAAPSHSAPANAAPFIRAPSHSASSHSTPSRSALSHPAPANTVPAKRGRSATVASSAASSSAAPHDSARRAVSCVRCIEKGKAGSCDGNEHCANCAKAKVPCVRKDIERAEDEE